jgi:ATP-dependent DNA helicase RecG
MRDLSRLLSQPEGQYFECKSLWHGPADQRQTRERRQVRDEIAEYVAAFANADGGTLVLGVEDDGTPSGHGYPNDAVDHMLQTPARRLTPPQREGERVTWQGNELLLFDVPAAERAVMVHGDGFPRRVDDTVVQESEEAINAIKARGRVEGVERDLAPGVGLDRLNEALIRRAQEGAGLTHIEPADYLCERRLADYRDGRLVLTEGALLLFARQARDIDHPNAGVRIFRVEGTERRTGPRHNVRELPRVEGALPATIERAYEVIKGLIRRSTRLHDLFFREMPEYPTFAWQEALVNGVAHRDYRSRGQCVEVWLFEDRLEVTSPGTLLPEVDLARLKRRERVHCSRNPRLVRVLADLALMREQGEGIPRIFEEMEQSWLRLPELRADEHSFTVTLHNQPILVSPEPEWVRHVQTLPIRPRQRRILVAYPSGSFANSDYQTLNEVDRDAAYRELRELVDLGLLTPSEGKGRAARYRVAAVGPAAEARSLDPRRVLASRMQERGFIQNFDLREVFNLERVAAKRELARLVATDVLDLRGRGRASRYVPGPGWDGWIHLRNSVKGEAE